jgi:hypothetical protein
VAAEFHLAEDALTLHLLFQHLEGLVDIVVTDENLHAAFLLDRAIDGSNGQGVPASGARIYTIRVPMGTIFGGLETFGLIGLFLGPAIMSVVIAMWREGAA